MLVALVNATSSNGPVQGFMATLELKSPRTVSFSDYGTAAIRESSSS